MLTDLIDAVIEAAENGTDAELERAYRNLEKVGVDRITAGVMIRARVNELEGGNR